MKRRYLLEEWNTMISKAHDLGKYPPEIIKTFRFYFFLGAYVLYERQISLISGDREVSQEDLRFMENVAYELSDFMDEFQKKGVVTPR